MARLTERAQSQLMQLLRLCSVSLVHFSSTSSTIELYFYTEASCCMLAWRGG